MIDATGNGEGSKRYHVNGRAFDTAALAVTYEGIVECAGKSGYPRVEYRDQHDGRHWRLKPGEFVCVWDGMRFHVGR
jgi:hypothetical protein